MLTPFVSPDFSSAEAQRLWYLKQLGVDVCVPRFILPGALPSQGCELTEQAEPVMPSTPPIQAPATLHAAAPRKPVFEGEAPTRKRFAEPAPADRPESMPPAAALARTEAIDPATQVQFRMVLLRAERGLVICNQVPLQNREGLNRQETRLLHNILHWLGSALLPEQQRLFVWPPPGMEGHASTADARLAGKSLFGFLEQSQQESRFTRLLLLGSSGPMALQIHRDAAGTPLPWQQFHSHSLGEMLVNAELKREAWQAMVPLHTLLQAA